VNGVPLVLGLAAAAVFLGRQRRRGSRESPYDRAWWSYGLEMYRRVAPNSNEYRLFRSHPQPHGYATAEEDAERWLRSLPLDEGGPREWLLRLGTDFETKDSYYWYFYIPSVISRFDNAAFKGQARLTPRTRMFLTGPRVVVK